MTRFAGIHLPRAGHGAARGAGRWRRPPAVLAALFAVMALLSAGAQGELIPERFATTLTDTDFPGSDLTSLTDITLERCTAACLRDGSCAAFTFNQRYGVCFLKSATTEPVPFVGAVSGVVSEQPAGAEERARRAAAEMTFLSEYDFAAALDQATGQAQRYFAEGNSEAALLEEAPRRISSTEVTFTGAAVTVADSGTAWARYAEALLGLAVDEPNRAYERESLAVSAAVNASLRLEGRERAQALLTLARALERRYRGEAALGAVRLADALVPGIAGDDLRRLQEAFGFRVLTHDVDSRTAAPRICVTFSEELAPARDYEQFVQRSTSGLALEVEGQQLCVSGVAYGESYWLTLRAGLPSAGGDVLLSSTRLDVYVRDRTPVVRFPGRAYVLPATGPRSLPVETVNADHLELRLMRVSDRNVVASMRDGSFLQSLSAWEGRRFEEALTETVWEGEADLEGSLNREVTSQLPLAAAGDLEPGLYVLRAKAAGTDDYDSPPAMQWFLVSDLGVTTLAGSDGVHVVVQRLSTGGAVEGVRVALVARSNRVLGEATTDAAGHVLFAAALALGAGNAAPAMVLVEDSADMAVLSLEEPEFDLSDRGVEGRVAPGPLDVFLATDRGAYRPGETVNLTALVRDDRAVAVSGLPLTVVFSRPDGVEYSRTLSRDDGAGGHVVALPLGGAVPRGAWRIDAYVDVTAKALATRTVLVEDFLPERIDVVLTLPGDGPIDPAAPPDLHVQADYLFGAPGAGLVVDGSVTVAPTDELPGWQGYSFGRADERVDPERRSLAPGVITDATGAATVRLPLDRLSLTARPYQVTATVTVIDGSSRPVERSLTRSLRPSKTVVGIRPAFDGPLPEGAEAGFDLVLVGPDGTALGGDIAWRVDRVDTRYQWYSVSGRWFWEPVTERQRVAEGTAAAAGGPVHVSVPVGWGRYELRASHEGATLASASLPFTAGWAAADTTRETPDLLAVSLDAAAYAPGDVARLRIDAAEPGVALVSVLTDRVVDLRLVEVEGETTVELPVTDEWGAGAYVTASLIRPSGASERLPARSLGLAHANVDPGARLLTPKIVALDTTRSGGPLAVTLEVPGLPDGAGHATVAAVDVGVLNITGFKAPDPATHYFGQRRLGIAIRDLYGRLIDARQGAPGEVRSGGDGGADEVSAGPAPAEDLLALFSGPVEVRDGRAEVTFDLPPFDGTVRLMAVVWTATAVGQAVKDVLVRDPVVIQASLPRFMTPGDESRLHLELTHVSGPAGEVKLAVGGHGLAGAPDRVELAEGGRAVIDLPLAPTELGEHVYRIDLTTPGGVTATRELRLTVMRTDPETARTTRTVLAPGASLTFGVGALDGFLTDTARATLSTGLGGAFDVPGLVMNLLEYPYGCTEQVVSSLQPLLLAPATAVRLGLVAEADVLPRVQAGVDRVLTRQGRTGSFGLWSVGGGDLWLDAYVTDFLLRAEAAGAVVPAAALRSALDNLSNGARSAGSMSDGAAQYAYAFYVLARAGEAVIGDLRYYADTFAASFDTPLAAAQLGAALALYGEQARADALFGRAQRLALQVADDAGWRTDYGTALRDAAGVLVLAAEAGTRVVDRPELIGLVTGLGQAALLSPQEAAWALRAAVATLDDASGLELDGRPVTGNVYLSYAGADTVLRNGGDSEVVATITTFGVPAEAPRAGGVGYDISRTYLTTDGRPADVRAVRVGDRLVVVLEVRPQAGVPRGRLIIDDALPAGLEIDNANLLASGDVSVFEWLRLAGEPEFAEARSDRFLAAIDQTSGETVRLAYVARAVSPGTFHAAAPLVMDLYRPINRAVGETSTLVIGR